MGEFVGIFLKPFNIFYRWQSKNLNVSVCQEMIQFCPCNNVYVQLFVECLVIKGIKMRNGKFLSQSNPNTEFYHEIETLCYFANAALSHKVLNFSQFFFQNEYAEKSRNFIEKKIREALKITKVRTNVTASQKFFLLKNVSINLKS